MEKYYMAAMGGAEGFGNRSIAHLVEYFGSAKEAWFADADELFKSGVRKNYLEAFIVFRGKYPNAPENLVKYCERHNFSLCSINDENYPPILKEINSPPMFFYYRGKIQPLAQRIGIVGSRENTTYGQNVALEFGEELAAAGLTVVSGAARGIDTFAHRGALKTGRTVAVLGCGIDIAFRSSQKNFFEEITDKGVVLSEFPPQLPPNIGTFPTRNRIIAGLCKGVIVVEAGKRSGALLTSNFAGDYGRDVFAIPGQIYAEKSVGCHELIREGAILIKSAQDILNDYNISVAENKTTPTITLDSALEKVLEVIPFDKFITDDEILEQVDEISPSELPNIILELGMKDYIIEDAGRYKRKLKTTTPRPKLEPKIVLKGVAAKVLEVIPFDKFITDDEILEQVDEISPSELPNIILELGMKDYIMEDAGRYKRKLKTAPRPKLEPKIVLKSVAAKVLEAIPFDKFITDDEILEQVDEISPSELPNIILELEMKNYVKEDAGRYKRKIGG